MDIERIEIAIVKRAPWVKGYFFRLLMLLLVIGISATLFVFRDNVIHLRNYGYAGAFLIAMISSATVFLPVPGLLLVITMSTILNPLVIGLVSGVGATLGETTAYMVGSSGAPMIRNSSTYQRAEGWMKKRGGITIFVLALVPNPLFDIAGIAAGVLRFPYWKFLVFCGSGKILKFCAISLAAAWGMRGVLDLIERIFG
ncbi:MAG: VTT domain-containing protein [Dehalococcoidia bacterium]|nr:VTT domain-containing protein [Dehalococcoidia bacterium]